MDKVKEKYIENMTAGMLVCFREDSGKMQTAAFSSRNLIDRMLTVETQYGRVYIVSYDKVIWVKAPNKQWPSFVYKELKGEKVDDENVG
ncbi:hypothetical protein [Clostridium sp.]|uniref:hypothetical protein n=1 Tax=Clostridium sp. TaxID=1506 RepID=UPI001A50450A|nr:hypothetical protein [Clostridium sp.]MBK5234065.1 hypothetical protein [Clostridium sp.]